MHSSAHSVHSSASFFCFVAVFVVFASLAWHATALAQPSTPLTQSSVENGVTIKVTPKGLSGTATDWHFAVVLDTHSQELSDDLSKTAVLHVSGQQIAAKAWSGAPAGGHHREGLLIFPAPANVPETIELRIQRANESSARTFRWNSAALR
jgi:hypothetical protein